MTEKTVNYTVEMVNELVEAYTQAEGYEAEQAVVLAFAEKFGKTKGSIVAKLSSQGVYNAKVAVAKGKAGQKKAELVGLIAKQLGVTEEFAESLEKVNKNVLVKVYGVLGALKYNVE
jgi:hypothetical protein